MNKFSIFVAAVAVSFTVFLTSQETDENTSQVKFMQRKLEFTKDIVAGLATEDFTRITKGSQDLMLLSNESNWNSINSPDYLKASSDFRETVERLRTAGKEENLDAATLAYFEVTLNCVRCHRQLRSGFKLQKPIPSK